MIENIKRDILEAMLSFLPIDFTFIDEGDRIRFFNKKGDRIFLRPRSIIGNKVHDCHPDRIIPTLQRVLDEMKEGTRDDAVFWMDHDGRKVYVRFIAVRDKNGGYLGCMETSQDVTDILEIEGERKFLI
jgi:PAS domain S-box-containing protein